MKKTVVIIAACVCLSSCATLLGGRISDCQRTKPLPGTPSRKVRIIPLLIDGPVGLIIDFSDGAIYKPCKK